jgi:uncharacterized protein (TIGR00730 family)
MRAVCVFCGANSGDDPAFTTAAQSLGAAVAKSGRALVYGGAKVGLMGAVADAALAAGGQVIGVIPQALVDREVAHPGLSELHVVAGMHERKMLMAALADGFIAMPGGLGTLEELFEVWTWAQLGLHEKPLGLFGTARFFGPLLAYLDSLVEHRFVRREHRDMVAVEEDPNALLARLESYRAVPLSKWEKR